jgi:phospholipase/lecithinase/hemolysin
MKEYTQLVNDIYAYRTPYELLIAKRYPDASIAVMDMNSFMREVYYNPTPYLTSPVNVTGQYYLCDVATGNTCTSSNTTLDHYFWYDELHPSQQVDKAIAKEFINVVKGTSKYATYW